MASRPIKSVFLMFVLCIAGCGESVELHGRLSEQEANEVIAELQTNRSAPKKAPLKTVCPCAWPRKISAAPSIR